MPVVQISRIQARRGLQQDLPQLASAELGWSIDQRRLYIGNGTSAEGAPTEGVTEILTQHSDLGSVLFNYIFKGNAGGYTTQTGSSVYYPTVRTWQSKIDETVSVKDFGAKGDGTTDDTAAINRALTEIYKASFTGTSAAPRRAILFPAGTYIVNTGKLILPTWARIVGEGMNSTIIRATSTSYNSLIEIGDSKFQTGASIGLNSATLPGYVTIENMSLQHTAGNATTDHGDVVVIDSAKHVYFRNVEFKGPLVNPTTAGSTAYAGIKFKSQVTAAEDITFDNCNFVNTRNALYSNSNSKNIRVVNSYFNSVYKAVKLGETPAATTLPRNWKIVNSYFASVANRAIDCLSGVADIVSSGNHYGDCGNNFAGSGSPVASIIVYNTSGSYSLGDSFDRPDADDAVYVRVSNNNQKSVTLNANVGVVLGNLTISTSGTVTLADAQTSFTLAGITMIDGATMNYTLTRADGIRTGSITAVTSTEPNFTETFTTTGDMGVTLIAFGNLAVGYTTSATGTVATLKYNQNYFK